jgi:glutathione S-transferase
MARWGKRIFDLPSEFPAVHAHLARVEQDPAVQFAIAIEKQLEASSPTGAFAGHVPLAG